MRGRWIVACLLPLSLFATVPAQAVAPPFPSSASSALLVAPAFRLQALPFAYPSFNNCGPQSIGSVLGYDGLRIDQQQVAQATKAQPRGDMSAAAIGQFVARFGLQAQRFVGGRREHLQALLRLGIPVIVLQWLRPDLHIPHFRVVTGFDDRSRNFLVLDPLYGPAVFIPYTVFDTLWQSNRAQFIPVYPSWAAASTLR